MENKISLQDIFSAAWKSFIVDGNDPAYSLGNGCCYLTPSLKKCAVGLCIPDGHEAQNFKGSFDEVVKKYPELWNEEILLCNKNILNQFQCYLHDGLQSGGKWLYDLEKRKEKYKSVAKGFYLEVPQE